MGRPLGVTEHRDFLCLGFAENRFEEQGEVGLGHFLEREVPEFFRIVVQLFVCAAVLVSAVVPEPNLVPPLQEILGDRRVHHSKIITRVQDAVHYQNDWFLGD